MLIIVLLVIGFSASQMMVRQLFPVTTTNSVMVQVVYPGADPREIEEGVSRKIEEAIDGMRGIKQYRTVSSENSAQAVIEILQDYPVDKALSDIESAINAISTFPRDAEKPIISEIEFSPEVMKIAAPWGN